VTAVSTFAYVFVDWGHGAYVIREIARYPERAGELMGSVLAVRAVTAAALSVPAVLIGWLLGYPARTLVYIAALMAAWIPVYLGLTFGWAFRGKERMEFDALINVAALTDRGTILDTSPELFDRMFAVNVRAPFFLMQDAAKIMRREKIRGTVVNILSMSAHGGQPFITAYCSSKGALLTLTKNVAFGLMRDGIRVNGLNIGWMDTPGEDRIMRLYHDAQDGWRERAEAGLPFGRMVKVGEVARAVAYLASEESGLMTGSIIDFDQSVLGCYEASPQPSPTAS